MAVSTWAAKTKKQADDDGEASSSPSKVLGAAYERNLKRMEGNLTLLKENSVASDQP